MNAICRRVAQIACFVALLSFAGPSAQAQGYVFGSASYSAPGLVSTSPPQGNAQIVTTDFNGDGIPDIAILGTISSGPALSIFLGKPDGSFGPRADYAVQASGFTVGDFNGDGKVDVIVVYSTSLSILFGNGDGTLQAPVPLNQSLGNLYSTAASADFNGDGKLDLLLLTPDFGSGATMAILLGNGDGTFQAPVTYSVPIAPYLVVGDFNLDGKPDIAISGGLNGGVVSILINNGDGTFKFPLNYSISGNVQGLATADLNGDGKLDLVVPSSGTSATISVLLGNGDGTFGSPIVYTSNLLSTSIAVADFNGDGKPDLALTDLEGPINAVAILLGNGDGTFQNPPLLYSAGLLPAGVISLDVNGDGKPDLAVAGGYGVLSYFSLTTLINRGDGTFANPANFPVLQFPYSAVVGDFNGDGHVDIATTSFTQTGGVSVLLGKDDGTFQAHVDSPTGQSPTAIATGDFNGDGKLDLVVADSSPTNALLSTLIGNGDGTFQNNISQTVPGPLGSLAVGDFNGDGKLDVAAVTFNTSVVSIFLGHGDGSFAAPVQYSTGPMAQSPPYHNVLTGDFNGDGKLDLAVATDNGIAVLLGNGDGTFQPFSLVPSLLSYDPGDDLLALADFNGDGKLDIIRSTQTGIINVALGNGDGTFQQGTGFQIPAILNTESAVVGDFNGDGKLDLAFASQSSDVVTILFGNGDGTFEGHIEYSVPSVSNNVNFMLAGDFNGDGALDMALADFDAGEVSVFINQPVAAFNPRALKFANQGIGTTSPEQSVTLTNGGAAPLAIAGIASSGEFAESNDCGSSLSIGQACNVSVSFAPTVDEALGGLLSFTDNASVVPQTLVLSGTGTGDFAGTFNHGAASASPGGQATYGLTVVPSGRFNGAVVLSASNLPPGATASWSPAIVTGAPWTSTLTVSTSPTTPPGNYTITVAGQSGALSHATTLTLLVGTVDFTGSVTPTSQAVPAGNSALYNIALSTLGTLPFGSAVALSVSGVPSGVTAGFSTTTVNPDTNGTSVLTLSTSGSTPVGSYTLTLSGTGGGVFHSTTIQLVVTTPGPVTGDFSGSFDHGTASANVGGQATYVLTVTPSGGFTGSVVLSVSGLPPGTTGSWSPAVVIGGSGTSALTITTGATTPLGAYNFTVSGASGTLTHSTTLTLLVGVVDFTGSVTPTSQTVFAGNSALYNIVLFPVGTLPFGHIVTLSLSGLPAGVTAILSNSTINPDLHNVNSSSVLTLTTSSSTPVGSYTLTLTGTGGGVTHSTGIRLTVQ